MPVLQTEMHGCRTVVCEDWNIESPKKKKHIQLVQKNKVLETLYTIHFEVIEMHQKRLMVDSW